MEKFISTLKETKDRTYKIQTVMKISFYILIKIVIFFGLIINMNLYSAASCISLNDYNSHEIGSAIMNSKIQEDFNVNANSTSSNFENEIPSNVDSLSTQNPKLNVIGWHYYWEQDKILSYNFKSLDAIYFHGFELKSGGEINYEEHSKGLKELIEAVQGTTCKVFLSIYCKSDSSISYFLNDMSSKVNFLEDLKAILSIYSLEGININFETVNSNDFSNYVVFLKAVNKAILDKKSSLQLSITLPADRNQNFKDKNKNFKFEELNKFVDQYVLLTDMLIQKNIYIAQPRSPLLKSTEGDYGSIESTVDFYENSKVPLSKMFLSVSYLGIEWLVEDINGDLSETTLTKNHIDIKYMEIVKEYLNQKDSSIKILSQGYDFIFASSFINFVRNGSLKQVWFEDERSLEAKYKWAYNRGLGGISIKGLGYDFGRTELWNALETNIFEVDPHKKELDSLKAGSLGETKISKGKVLLKKLRILMYDIQWASISYLKYNDTCICEFPQDKNAKFTENFDSTFKHDMWIDFAVYEEFKQVEPKLMNVKQCISLKKRWSFYAWFSFWCWIISLSIAFILLITLNLLRIKGKTDGIFIHVLRICRVLFFVLGAITLLFYLYINPNIKFIGYNEHEDLVYFLIAGSVIGAILSNWWYNKRYVPKDMP